MASQARSAQCLQRLKRQPVLPFLTTRAPGMGLEIQFVEVCSAAEPLPCARRVGSANICGVVVPIPAESGPLPERKSA